MNISQLIERFWYSSSRISWLLWPLSLPILLLVGLKRFFFQTGMLESTQSKLPVIVVGNITVGGTGKTPLIAWLVSKLSEQNLRVGIVSRGYQSCAEKYPHIVSEKDSVLVVGDEAYMQFKNLRIPMAIGANRAEVIKHLSANAELDVIISDDGLQHYKMSRDFEILTCDASRAFGNALMLPFGPLREPRSRLKSVDYIVVNGDKKVKDLQAYSSKTIAMQMQVVALVNMLTGEQVSLEQLSSRSVAAVCGIGNPQRFFASLQTYCEKMQTHIFADHYAFQISDFDCVNADLIVMTEKDAVKCENFARDNWYYLKVNAAINQQDCARLLKSLMQKIQDSGVING